MRLKLLRKQKHMSQLSLAMKLNTTQLSISRYETGKREPDLKTLLYRHPEPDSPESQDGTQGCPIPYSFPASHGRNAEYAEKSEANPPSPPKKSQNQCHSR